MDRIMDWAINTILLMGFFAFIAQSLLKLSAKDSLADGSLAWKWKNVLLIIAGCFLFVFLGLVNLWRLFDVSESVSALASFSSIAMSIVLIAIGTFIIRKSVRELFNFTS
jgi:hypothetical protein